jgi:hypothetical protein
VGSAHDWLLDAVPGPHDPAGNSSGGQIEWRGDALDRAASPARAERDTSAIPQFAFAHAKSATAHSRDDAEGNGRAAANQVDDGVVELIVPNFDDGAVAP